MSDFSKHVASQLKLKAEQKRIAEAKSLQDRQTLDKGLADFWNAIREKLKLACEEINQEPEIDIRLNCNVQDPKTITLSRSDTGAYIVGSISGSDHLFFQGKNGLRSEEMLSVRLAKNGVDCYIVDSSDRPLTGAEQITNKLVAAL